MKQLSSIVVLLLVSSAIGQQASESTGNAAVPATKAARNQRHLSAVTNSMKQLEPMKKMTDSFAGLWNTTITLAPGGLMGKGGTAHGRANITSGPAGNSLRESFFSYGAMGAIAGFGLTWWDGKAAAYRNVWCDNMSPNGCDLTGTGQWEASSLVFHGTSEVGGKPVTIRETFSDITPNSFVFTMESSVDDAPMKKVMTINYQRAVHRSASEPANPVPATSTQTQSPAHSQ